MAVFVAAVLRSFTGFGFALVAVPVFALFLPPTDVVVLSAALALTISLLGWSNFRRSVSVRDMMPLLVTAAIGTALGALFLPHISRSLFQASVGVAVLIACAAMVAVRPARTVQWPALPWVSGFLSGLMNGALAIPGPPMILHIMMTEFDPGRSRALLMAFFLVSSGLALLTYVVAGYVHWSTVKLFVFALPALYVGDRLGHALFLRFGSDFYRRVALLALAALGVSITVRALI